MLSATGGSPSRIAVFTSQPVLAEAFRALLSPNGHPVITGADLNWLTAACQSGGVRVAILDSAAVTSVEVVSRSLLPARSILWDASIATESLPDALQNGIRGAIPSDSSPDAILRAVQQVESGHLYFPVFARQHSSFRLATSNQQLLELLSRGLTNEEIAVLAGRSRQSVKTSICRLYRRFGVNSRLELAIQAIRHSRLSQRYAL